MPLAACGDGRARLQSCLRAPAVALRGHRALGCAATTATVHRESNAATSTRATQRETVAVFRCRGCMARARLGKENDGHQNGGEHRALGGRGRDVPPVALESCQKCGARFRWGDWGAVLIQILPLHATGCPLVRDRDAEPAARTCRARALPRRETAERMPAGTRAALYVNCIQLVR